MISMIVAMAKNGIIGANNQLPWHIPEDLKRFKQLTMGKPVIMGRKTFESIGKPLPGRRNIVMSLQAIAIPDVEIVSSISDALQVAKSAQEVMIIGGAEIYRLFMPYSKYIYQTLIHSDVEGDTFFPEIRLDEWEVQSEELHDFWTYKLLQRQGEVEECP